MRWRRSKSREHDLDRELRAHLELEAEEQQAAGLAPQEAFDAARRAFGNLTLTKEEVRQMWGWTTWGILAQDLRYALRNLMKAPGFAAAAILTLALGIGASTAVFTVVDSVILKPLAYRDSGRLVVAWERLKFVSDAPMGPNPRHEDLWRKRATDFSGMTLLRYAAWGLSTGADHPNLTGAVVCQPNLFDVLGVQPLAGRLTVSDAEARAHHFAILTYPLWQSIFHGDPAAIGQTIRLNDTPREVIGVLPANFHFPNGNTLRPFTTGQHRNGVPEPAVFLPFVQDLNQFAWNGDYANWLALGRLKPGVTPAQAEAQLKVIQAQIVRENADQFNPDSLSASVQPMQEAITGDSGAALWLLLAAVLGLMLIACLNLANAQLSRALARRREAAVRMALGAARWRVIWSSLAENAIVAAAGGLAGILFAAAALSLFRRYSPVDLPRLAEVRLNLTVLLFSLLLALLASLLSGLLPALRLLRADPQTALQQNSTRTLGSRQSHRLRVWLIGFQVAGCTALLLVTGLFSKSLLYLLHQDKGFETSHVAVAEVVLPSDANRSDLTRIAFDDRVLANLRAIPGVQAAALVSAMPLEGESWIEPVHRADRHDQEGTLVNLRFVSAGYFEALRAPLIAGRFFKDPEIVPGAAVLSEGEAKALWGSENPIGGQVIVQGRTCTVIGVAADSHSTSLKAAPVRMAYVNFKDRPPYNANFLARGAQSAEALMAAMRPAIWKSAPGITIARVKTLDAQLADSVGAERLQTYLLLGFGAAALLLAMLGIYGVLSYSVASRKQEIGVRMALGASRGSVYALAFLDAGAPTLAGLAVGLTANLLAGRAIGNLLYGVRAIDLPVILAVTAVFLISAAVAAFVPARRAASVDPMDALRSE